MGVSTEQQNSDLTVAFFGGDTFMQRMEQLSAAKFAAENAEASLNLAMSAKSILDQVDAKTTEANRLLADAKANAKATIDEANAKAQAVIKDADAKYSETVAKAKEVRAASEAYAADAQSRADATLAEAVKVRAAAVAELDRLKNAQAQAAAERAASDEAVKAANAVKAKYGNALAALRVAFDNAVSD